MISARADVDIFLDSYRAAFERLDVAAIADHFAYPVHITNDAGDISVLAVPARTQWIGNVERLVGMYQAMGFRSARALDVELSELSPRLVQATVHWGLSDAEGRALYDFLATYTLAKIGDALRITAISTNEVERYLTRVSRKNSSGFED